MAELRIGIIGFGKIARDQHLPAIMASRAFRLMAVVTPDPTADPGVPVFADTDAMLSATALDAVAICTPPGPRHAIARTCLEAGLHVLIEKPPCATLGELQDLAACAALRKRTLFTAWHSQHNDTVVRAAAITRAEGIASLDIQWLEDVEKWHPGQEWIWEAGGFGVFDPGINALSIATLLCPQPLLARAATMTMHAQGEQPEVVDLVLATDDVEGLTARFDWRHKGDEQWTIAIVTKAGTRIDLSHGGARLRIDAGEEIRAVSGEYPAIYQSFAKAVEAERSEIDAEPLRLVADTTLVAHRDNRQGKR